MPTGVLGAFRCGRRRGCSVANERLARCGNLDLGSSTAVLNGLHTGPLTLQHFPSSRTSRHRHFVPCRLVQVQQNRDVLLDTSSARASSMGKSECSFMSGTRSGNGEELIVRLRIQAKASAQLARPPLGATFHHLSKAKVHEDDNSNRH